MGAEGIYTIILFVLLALYYIGHKLCEDDKAKKD